MDGQEKNSKSSWWVMAIIMLAGIIIVTWLINNTKDQRAYQSSSNGTADHSFESPGHLYGKTAAELTGKGQNLFEQGRYNDALVAFKQALESSPPSGTYTENGSVDNIRYRIALVWCVCGAEQGANGDKARSDSMMKTALQWCPPEAVNTMYDDAYKPVMGRAARRMLTDPQHQSQ